MQRGPLFRPFGRDLSEQAPKPPSGNRSSRPGNGQQYQRDWARISSLGVEFALTVGVMGFLGWKLDSVLGLIQVFPIFLLVGTLLGMALGIYRMNYQLNAWVRRQRQAKSEAEDQSLEQDRGQQ
ncbi:MAG: AtpZ/AtpI family protein [Planctomycetes bacterium]|nr:AtpZ/AtpI family protein [Planctomycetota bacterium]